MREKTRVACSLSPTSLPLSNVTVRCLPPFPFILAFAPPACLPPTALRRLPPSTWCASSFPCLMKVKQRERWHWRARLFSSAKVFILNDALNPLSALHPPAAHQQCRLHRSSGDWWDCSSGNFALKRSRIKSCVLIQKGPCGSLPPPFCSTLTSLNPVLFLFYSLFLCSFQRQMSSGMTVSPWRQMLQRCLEYAITYAAWRRFAAYKCKCEEEEEEGGGTEV